MNCRVFWVLLWVEDTEFAKQLRYCILYCTVGYSFALFMFRVFVFTVLQILCLQLPDFCNPTVGLSRSEKLAIFPLFLKHCFPAFYCQINQFIFK